MATKTIDRSITQRVQDMPYVALGASDAAVEFVRTLPTQIQQLPTQVKDGFDGLADRGRNLGRAIERDPAVRRAGRQTTAAKSKVKAAATSTRTAAKTAGTSARSAATSSGRAVEAQAKAGQKVAGKLG